MPRTGGDFKPYRSRTATVLATVRKAVLQAIWGFLSYLFPLVTEINTAVLKSAQEGLTALNSSEPIQPYRRLADRKLGREMPIWGG